MRDPNRDRVIRNKVRYKFKAPKRDRVGARKSYEMRALNSKGTKSKGTNYGLTGCIK